MFSHREVTVLFVPDLSECLPSLDAWRDQWLAHKRAVAEREAIFFGKREVQREERWDEREADASDVDRLQKQKQYFVKYKGLAHVHNRWFPENQLLLEAPRLVAKFSQKKNQIPERR
jgi:hypothetical protein